MGLSVRLVDHPALGARSGRVSRIDCDQWNPDHARLVSDELAKLGECPPMQTVALCLSGLNPLADVRQILDGNREAVAFGVRNDLLGDTMVHVLAKAGLLPAELLQAPLGGFAASTLQSGATTSIVLASGLDGVAGVRTAMAIEGEVDDAEVDAEHAFNIDLARVGNVTNAGEIELAAHEHQINLALAEGEQGALALAADERDALATFQRPDAHAVIHHSEDAVVVGLSRVLAKRDDLWRAPIGLVGGVRISDLGNAAHGDLSSEAEARSCLGVGQLVQVELARLASTKAALREVVAGFIATLQRLAQELFLISRRLELNVRNELHAFKYRVIWSNLQQEAALLPGLNAGVSARIT